MSTIAVPVEDASQVADARRRAVALAAAGGTGQAQRDTLALVVTELATNLLKHAGGGQVVVQSGDAGLDVLALDRGPGIGDIRASMADGYSTAGTAGTGLGAVRRLCSDVRVLSWHGVGTAVHARLAAPGQPPADDDVGALVVPMPGEESCGDAFSTHRDARGRTLMLVDGLGHGPQAASAAHAAVGEFQRRRGETVARIVQSLHDALRPTRGAAVAVARIDWDEATVSYAGIGNIAALLRAPDGTARRLVSHNGTAGHNARRIQAFDYPGARGLLVLHTDGIGSHWSLDRYPGLVQAHPLLVCGVLYHHHARGRDDCGLLVARTTAP
jgi:anti-sigma regulatory factor (Ser/Thr protein kinase)